MDINQARLKPAQPMHDTVQSCKNSKLRVRFDAIRRVLSLRQILHTDPISACSIETLDEFSGRTLGFCINFQSVDELIERKIRIHLAALDLPRNLFPSGPEIAALLKNVILRAPTIAFERARYQILRVDDVPNLGSLPMHELGAEFYRNRKPWIAQGLNAPADSVACFEDGNSHSPLRQLASGRKASQAGTDDDYSLHGSSCRIRRVIIGAVKKHLVSLALTVAVACGGCGSNTTPSTQTSNTPAASQAPSVKAPDESAALDTIAKINDAQSNYFRRNRRYALTFEELVDAHLISSPPASAQTGYDFSLRPSADAQTYKLAVNPTAASPTARHFFSDESGTVRAEAGRDATGDSPKI